MTLTPTITEILARARADLGMGVPVTMTDGERAVVAAAAETLTAARLADLRRLGDPVLALTSRRAETLKARAYDGDLARIEVPPEAQVDWVQSMADPSRDLAMPMKGPHRSQRGGAADLQRAAIRLAKTARLLPAMVTVAIDDARRDDLSGLTRIDTIAAGPVMDAGTAMHEVISARVPLRVSAAGRVHVFRPDDGAEEHYAVEIGKPSRETTPLVRLHSACLTGDLLGSLKCDCGPQLQSALETMGAAGAGVLLYLNQEGRGIGLANKLRAYSLQDQGFDTVEANHRLGFEDDERDFRIGADILKRMGFSRIRLLTNNPRKVAMMQQNGVEVTERVPLRVGLTPENAAYLDAKAKKSGHIL